MRDGFVFYRSFFECFSNLSKKDKLVLFDALCNYALNDVEPELVGTPAAIFKLLKPQIDANNRRYENGKKGGRPKKTEAKPNENQDETKAKRKEQVQVQVQDKVKEQVQEQPQPQEKALGSSGGGSGSDDDDFNIWKRMSPADVDAVYDVYPDSGGDLIQTVYEDVKKKRKKVKNPVPYILGYAEKVGWDDHADHGGAL